MLPVLKPSKFQIRDIEMIDLHTHSTASDGSYTPTELINYAKSKGIRVLALTDHDTIAGISEAIEASASSGIDFIPGVEISALWLIGTMHILGYYIDPDSELLHSTLEHLQKLRDERNHKIIEKLREHGIDITYEEVEKVAGGQIGRLHISRILIEKGYAADVQSAFKKFLTNGAPTYIPKVRLEPPKAIELIKKAGGIPVLAHPCTLGLKEFSEFEKLFSELKEAGIEGIEAYYSDHSRELTDFCLAMADKLDLLVTGGSDFHGSNKKHIDLGVGRGDLVIPDELAEGLKRYRENRS